MSDKYNSSGVRFKPGNYMFPATLVLFAIVMWWLMGIHYHDLLLKIESRTLFLSSGMFFREKMQLAGGLLLYVSCFLTQFLKYPLFGTALIVLMWCGTVLLTRRAFKLDGALTALAFIPAALLAAEIMSQGYMIYILRVQGWFFSPTLGYIISLCTILFLDRIGNIRKRSAVAALWVIAGYALCGPYALLGALASTVRTVTTDWKKGAVPSAVVLFFIIAAPLFWAGQVYYTGRVADAYIAALPKLPGLGQYFSIWLPFILLALFTLAASCACWKYSLKDSVRADSTLQSPLLYVSIIVVTVIIARAFWYSDPVYLTEMKMDAAMERRDWKEVTRIMSRDTERFARYNERVYHRRSGKLEGTRGAERNDIVAEYRYRFHQPTRVMVMYKNLALLRLGTAGSQAFCYADGDYEPKVPIYMSLSTQCAKQLYLNYGLANCCYRWCIEDAVEFGWSAETLIYAIKSTLAIEDWNIAEKYISVLELSPVHRKWAHGQRALLHHPELLRESPEYRDIIPMLTTSTMVTSDEAMTEKFLLQQFRAYSRKGATPQGSDAAMLWTLYSQDIDSFWRELSIWIETHPDSDIPRHYQEAAYLYSNLEGDGQINVSPDVAKSYRDFMSFVSHHPVENIHEMSYLYEKKFGRTFYYFYYFVRDQKSH